MSVKIIGVENASLAQAAGLSSGTLILCINGNEINDMLDYDFYTKEEVIELAVIKETGKLEYITINKSEYEDLGCNFESYLIDKKHSCKNKCIFCFIDQMPKNMRETLYFKDDDERLSFLFGNYITLTNLSEREVKRITQMHISPINISVHTMNPTLRVKMMANPNAGDVLKYIDEFAKSDIKMNCQLVLCKNVNDGEELRFTLKELFKYYPAIQSIAAVPSGLTKYREGLYPLQPYDMVSAQEQLEIMEELGEQCKSKLGTRLIYPADEWYLLAQKPIPQNDFYEDYLQFENGVGMWRVFHDEFIEQLSISRKFFISRRADIATGALAYPLISSLCEQLEKKYKNIKIKVHRIENEFFGGNVSVAGLITAGDIIKQLKGNLISKTLCIPNNMLRAENDKFLDDITVKELEKVLRVKVKVMPQNGAKMLEMLLK